MQFDKITAFIMSALALLSVLAIVLPWSRGPVLGPWGPARKPLGALLVADRFQTNIINPLSLKNPTRTVAGRELWSDDTWHALLVSGAALFAAAATTGIAPLFSVFNYTKVSSTLYIAAGCLLAGVVAAFILYFCMGTALFLGVVAEGMYFAAAGSVLAFTLVGRPLVDPLQHSFAPSPPVAVVLHSAPGQGARSAFISQPTPPQCPGRT